MSVYIYELVSYGEEVYWTQGVWTDETEALLAFDGLEPGQIEEASRESDEGCAIKLYKRRVGFGDQLGAVIAERRWVRDENWNWVRAGL